MWKLALKKCQGIAMRINYFKLALKELDKNLLTQSLEINPH